MFSFQTLLFRSVGLKCLKTKKIQLRFQNHTQPRTYFCTKKQDPPMEEPLKQEAPQENQNAPPSLAKEIFSTIKESTIQSAKGLKGRVRRSVKEFAEQANPVEGTSALGRCAGLARHAWKKTFPSHDEVARERMERVRVRQQKLQQEAITEDELVDIQDKIPEWKRTAVQPVSEGVEERPGLARQLRGKIASRVSQTEFAQRVSVSEEFKDYREFKSEMKQFKEDAKERIQNHPSNVVQGGIYVYVWLFCRVILQQQQKSITAENDIQKAIKQMRLIDPDFDLFQLEQDAKVIFENIYQQYLRGDLMELEKVCGEMALGYFKVLLKKREAEKSEPKYKYLWNCELAFFQKAYVPEISKLPVFIFNIKAQEIYCYVSKFDPKKIIDGDDERVMSMDYAFALTPHLTPDIESTGHSWEMIEIMPREVVKMLI